MPHPFRLRAAIPCRTLQHLGRGAGTDQAARIKSRGHTRRTPLSQQRGAGRRQGEGRSLSPGAKNRGAHPPPPLAR